MIQTYDDMMEAIKDRINELDVSYESVDECCGLSANYLSKLLGPSQIKKISAINLFNLLETVGLTLEVVPDPDTARVTHRLEKRVTPPRVPDGFSIPFKRKHLHMLRSENGRQGGRASGKKRKMLPKPVLIKAAKAGARARWSAKQKIAARAKRRQRQREQQQEMMV